MCNGIFVLKLINCTENTAGYLVQNYHIYYCLQLAASWPATIHGWVLLQENVKMLFEMNKSY